jgi:hypothetical protein
LSRHEVPQAVLSDTSYRGQVGEDDPALTAVTGAHLSRALDDLLDASQAVTRTLLGVGVDPADLPAGGALQRSGLPAMFGPTGRMMVARRTARFGSD